jgi:hypothetical protein
MLHNYYVPIGEGGAMLKVVCDRCTSESDQFFSFEADEGLNVATFEEDEFSDITQVFRLGKMTYLRINLPIVADSEGYTGSDYFYLCPCCVKELAEWVTGTEIKNFRITEPK